MFKGFPYIEIECLLNGPNNDGTIELNMLRMYRNVVTWRTLEFKNLKILYLIIPAKAI
jgi:hypothetical protein